MLISLSKRVSFFLLFFSVAFNLYFISFWEQTQTEEIIESTWSVKETEEEKKQVGINILENLEQKAKELAEKKAQEKAQLEYEIEQIKKKRKTLIKCMEQKGVILFSLPNCKPCKKQKDYFGEDFKEINFVDCEQSKYMCDLLRNIKAYPTWYLGRNLGIKKEGVMDLPTLARFTQCPW